MPSLPPPPSTFDFPLLQRIALPITVGAVRYPGIRIQDPRVIRLLEVFLHGGTHVGGWTAKQIHQAVLISFHLSDRRYGLNQLRYDLRKLKDHGLLQRDGSRYAYRLTQKGVEVALLFLFFHKRLMWTGPEEQENSGIRLCFSPVLPTEDTFVPQAPAIETSVFATRSPLSLL